MNLADIDKLPPAMRAQAMADQARTAAARERIFAQSGAQSVREPSLSVLPAKSPAKAIAAQVRAVQARAAKARERVLAQAREICSRPLPVPVAAFKADPALLAIPLKSPAKAVSEAMERILPQCPKVKPAKSKLPKVSESLMQQQVVRWFRDNCYEWQLDEELLMAFPLQGARSARNGARMKAEGMRRGTPDMLLAVPRGDCAGLWLELKTATGYLNPHQKVMLKRLTLAGYATVVTRSVEETTHAIRAYLNLPTRPSGQTP